MGNRIMHRWFLPAVLLALTPIAAPAAEGDGPVRRHPAYQPGEKLTYNVSWSDLVQAGTAVMEVRREKGSDGGDAVQIISTARSVGMVERFYPVRDTIKSLIDPKTHQSLAYSMDQSHGKRKKKRELVFDREAGTVTYLKEGMKDVVEVPAGTQDALSSLYYVRTHGTFTVGTSLFVNVHDSGKTWNVEVQVLGREKLKTPIGEFSTVKVKTYPKYDGVFMHKGEIFIWLTDDEHRVPLLMKSTITIGSVMATITEMKLGEKTQ